jgi:hypothetical protein
MVPLVVNILLPQPGKVILQHIELIVLLFSGYLTGSTPGYPSPILGRALFISYVS